METRLNRIVENTRSIGVMAQAGLEPSASEVLLEESQYLKDMYYIYESARRAPLATAISPMLLPIRSNLPRRTSPRSRIQHETAEYQ
jgi:hypothetical protein